MIALKTENDEFLWFDIVVSMNESNSRSATSFPVQSGGNISDHIANQNKQVSLTGVYVGNGFVKDVSTQDGASFTPTLVTPVTVDYNTPSSLQKLIPEGLASFIPLSTPKAVFDVEPQVTAEEKLSTLMQLWQSKEDITLVEINDKYRLITEIPNLVITSIQNNTSPDDGDSITVSVQFEEIRRVTLLTTQSPLVNVKDWRVVQQAAAAGARGTASSPSTAGDEESLLGPPAKKNTHLLNIVNGTPGA